jgi:intracellular multiplication protein IcmK
LKQVLFGVIGFVMINVAFAQDATTTGVLPASVPFAPPGSTVTTITTTTAPQAAAPAAAPVAAAPAAATGVPPAGAASTGVASGLAPAPTVQPGGVGLPGGLNIPGAPPAAGTSSTGAPAAQMVDPSLFGTLHDPSFQGMTGKMFPMTAEQIRAFRDIYETTKRITAEPPRTPPKPMVSSQTISLSPGTQPPIVRLANGYVTSVVFVDQTGAPWPVTAYSVGNPKAFNIAWDTESNLLMIQGQGAYVSGNMAVTLKKLDTPIMLTIVSEQSIVDYRVDFRVMGRGPNANGSIIGSSMPQNSNQLLMNLLDGVPPSDARVLEVEGADGQAWLRGSVMFLRTPLTVLSPSWQATMSSPDGTKVYQMNPTPMVLVSDRGQSVALKVKGF